MKVNKKVLYFFPLNPIESNAGSVTRARSLLNYFKDRGFTVDFMNSNDDWGGRLSFDEIRELQDRKLARRVLSISKKPKVNSFLHYLRYAIPNIFLRKLLKVGTNTLVNYSNSYRRWQFNEALKSETYDYVVLSYAYWAKLVENNINIGKAQLIIDTHDFLTAQDQHRRRFDIGQGFAEEIRRLNLFDQIWTISSDEQYLFSQFCTKPVKLIPQYFAPKFDIHTAIDKKPYDLIYVAGDNVHNINSSDWFFEEVYPFLSPTLQICVVGKINSYIHDKDNLVRVNHAEDLDTYYRSSKISICPMLTGSGVKIKVIEALSYGVPVVCTPKGVDGLVNKFNNGCLVASDPESFAKNIQELLEDDEKYFFHKNQAISFFMEKHSKDAVYKIIDACFLE